MPPTKPSPTARKLPRVTIPHAVFDVRQFLIILRAHIWVAVTLALVACTLLAWQQMRQPKLYAASAALLVEKISLEEGLERSRDEIGTMTRLEQLRSPELLQRVVGSFTPEERKLVHEPYAAAGAAVGVGPAVARIAQGAVSFGRREGTLLISVTATHRDPNAAALLVNRFAEQAIGYAFDRSRSNSEASLKFLRDQAEDLRKKSEAAERGLQEYRQRFNLVSLEANQNIIVDNLKMLNSSTTSSRVARMAIEARLEQAETVIKRGADAAQVAAITGFDSLADVARRLADLRGKRTVMAERYGRRHPAMQENQRVIEALERVRDEEMRTALATLRDQRDKALAEERELQGQRAKAEVAALDLDQLGVEYNILRRTVDTHKASYSHMLARLNDATISSQLRGVNLKVSELASPPGAPFSPNPRRTLMITIALGLAIIVGYPFSAEMLFSRIRSGADVEYYLGTDVLGEISAVRDIGERNRLSLVHGEQHETAVEQFRAFYSQLSLTSKIDPPKTILITSTVPGEGKSFIAANLAECFVAHGRRVLLVDADLRRPNQHRQFGLDNARGMLRWLDGGGTVDGDLLKDEALGIAEVTPGMFLLRAGGSSRKATELMEGGRLAVLLGALQRHFDVMILDTPPAGVFSDAAAFARVCHELIFVCRFNAVSRLAVRETIERLRPTELEFPGVVLNALPAGFGGSYYYRAYDYREAKRYREAPPREKS